MRWPQRWHHRSPTHPIGTSLCQNLTIYNTSVGRHATSRRSVFGSHEKRCLVAPGTTNSKLSEWIGEIKCLRKTHSFWRKNKKKAQLLSSLAGILIIYLCKYVLISHQSIITDSIRVFVLERPLGGRKFAVCKWSINYFFTIVSFLVWIGPVGLWPASTTVDWVISFWLLTIVCGLGEQATPPSLERDT